MMPLNNPVTCSHYTVIVRPIPRGISFDDLMTSSLLQYGQIKRLRFGEGKGAAADVMYIDYFEHASAAAAVTGLNGVRDPGTSRLRLQATLSASSADAIRRRAASEAIDTSSKRVRIESVRSSEKSIPTDGPQRIRPEGAFRYLKPKGSLREICVIAFNMLDS